MHVAPFSLERWFARYEHEADIMLAESGIRSLSADSFGLDLDPGPLGYVIPTNGDPAVRAAIADRYDREADEVLVTCGAQEANLLAFLAVVSADAHVVVVTPTYQSLYAIPDSIGDVTRVSLEPPDWRLDVGVVEAAMRPETVLVVVNNPNNPTGRYHPRGTIEAIAELAADNDAFLLCDEVYRLLADEPLAPVAAMADHGISTASLTKAHGLAGLRFGWLVGQASVVEAAWRWKDYTTISPSPIGQHVAAQVFDDLEPAILEANRALAARNRQLVREFVADAGLEWIEPVGVNGFVTVPDGFPDGEAFCRTVVERQSVVLAPGTCFGQPGYFRIGFGLPTPMLEAGLDRVRRVIADGP